MRRSLVTLVALMALAAWAGAQGPPAPLPAATQAKLFKSNRTLIESLVNHGLDLAATDRPDQRADECRKTATTLANSLGQAAEDQDPDRVVELAGLMSEVIRDGLVPNLNEAQTQADKMAGPSREVLLAQLAKVREKTTRELDELSAKIPTEGKVATQKVKEAVEALQGLKASLKKP